MNKFFFLCLFAAVLSSCSINKQAQQIKALEKCEYRVLDVNNVTLAGTDIKKLIEGKSLNLVNAPALALALLRKDVPLRADLQLEIKNPSHTTAAINNFDYIILINKQEIVNGTVDQRVSIDAGQTVNVPLLLNSNIYKFLSNDQVLEEIGQFVAGASNGKETKGLVTIKIRPSIQVAANLVKYPGYITIDKEVSSKVLL